MKRVALITGASDRLGKAMALGLAKDGYAIALHFHQSEEKARNVAAEIKSIGQDYTLVKADLSDPSQTAALVKNAADALGAVSVLVNSASQFEHDDVGSMTRASWQAHMEPNLWAPVKLAQDFAAQAPTDANNLIVNLIDQRVWKLTPQFLSYTASKAGLLTLTKTLAQALGPQGIRVNAIGPGPTLKNARQSDDDWDKQNAATLLGRGATPDDIVGALRYFVAATAVTGQMLAVDGGQHLVWQTPDVMVNE